MIRLFQSSQNFSRSINGKSIFFRIPIFRYDSSRNFSKFRFSYLIILILSHFNLALKLFLLILKQFEN
nr:MAG TPA: hypothetical protein [Caudoviricetes sp.]